MDEDKLHHFQSVVFFLAGCFMIVLLFLAFLKQMRESGSNLDGMEEGSTQKEETKEDGVHIPVIRLLPNVWIMESAEDGLWLFEDGLQTFYPWEIATQKQEMENETLRDETRCDKIADVLLTDERVSKVIAKEQKLHGIVHDYGKDYVTMEGLGRLELDKDYRGYRLYGEPKLQTVADLKIGCDDADFVVEDGKIQAILFARPQKLEEIRVLLKNGNNGGLFHEAIELYGQNGFFVQYQEGLEWKEEAFQGNQRVIIDRESIYLQGEERRMTIVPYELTGKIGIGNLGKEAGDPLYPGRLEIELTADGLTLINILPLEEYLCYVIPSEMPASYPFEALRAQAICARTYAYGWLRQAGYPAYGAHVDDSTQFQVYHNIGLQAQTSEAVKATSGMILNTKDGELAQTYYYAASCGQGTDVTAWGNSAEQYPYLKGKRISRNSEAQTDPNLALLMTEDPDDYEFDQEWYRWSCRVDRMNLEEVRKRLSKNLGKEDALKASGIQEIYGLEITERGGGGVALCLKMETNAGDFYVRGEHAIREALCNGAVKIKNRSGKELVFGTLLPSAFFLLDTVKKDDIVVEYSIIGGGFGHGIGMSQNAAGKMATDGKTAEEILAFFYEGCILSSIPEG